MAQFIFDSATDPLSTTNLDANFTELYELRNLFTVSGSSVGLGASPGSEKLYVGGNIALTGQLNASPGASTAFEIVNRSSGGGIRFYVDAGSALAWSVPSGATSFVPGVDNTNDVGSASFRCRTVYAGTGAINTSDAREKSSVRALTAAEIAAAVDLSREIGAYRFLVAVEQKGAAARQHIGMTVQRAIEVLQLHDLDPFAYGFVCYDSWPERIVEHPPVMGPHPTLVGDDGQPLQVELQPARTEVVPAGDRFAFRPDELHGFIARGLAARQDALEARLAALESAA